MLTLTESLARSLTHSLTHSPTHPPAHPPTTAQHLVQHHSDIMVLPGVLQLIIFLYLLDNETSTVVLFSAGIGCAIEFWKVTKAMTVSIDWSRGIPLPKFEDKAGWHALFSFYTLSGVWSQLWLIRRPGLKRTGVGS